MNKYKFTNSEKISLIIMIFIIFGLFISSSMTYTEQKFSTGEINHKFGLVEAIVKNWNIYYGGVWHNKVSDHGSAAFTQFIIRKFAHFTTFFLLGVFSFIGLKRLFKFDWTAPLFVWFYCVFWAVFDEFHQFLTGDRTPSIHDVVLDSAGSLVAIIICASIFFFMKKRRENRV